MIDDLRGRSDVLPVRRVIVAHGAIRGIFSYVDLAKSPGMYSMRFNRSAVFRQVAGVMWAIMRPLEAVYDYLGWDDERLHQVIAAAVTALDLGARGRRGRLIVGGRTWPPGSVIAAHLL